MDGQRDDKVIEELVCAIRLACSICADHGAFARPIARQWCPLCHGSYSVGTINHEKHCPIRRVEETIAVQSKAREKAEKEGDEVRKRVKMLEEALVTPIWPDDADMAFMERLPQRTSGGSAAEIAWWDSLAKNGFHECVRIIIQVWEAGRSGSQLVVKALAADAEKDKKTDATENRNMLRSTPSVVYFRAGQSSQKEADDV